MKFLPSKKLIHTDGLSCFILKFGEPLEDTVIAAIKTENEIKNVLHNTVRELLITQEETSNFILKRRVKLQKSQK